MRAWTPLVGDLRTSTPHTTSSRLSLSAMRGMRAWTPLAACMSASYVRGSHAACTLAGSGKTHASRLSVRTHPTSRLAVRMGLSGKRPLAESHWRFVGSSTGAVVRARASATLVPRMRKPCRMTPMSIQPTTLVVRASGASAAYRGARAALVKPRNAYRKGRHLLGLVHARSRTCVMPWERTSYVPDCSLTQRVIQAVG